MSGQAGKWGDLQARVLSAAAMTAIGLGGVWLGGLWFSAMVALICAGMVWELFRIMAPSQPGQAFWIGALAGVVVIGLGFLPAMFLLPVVVAVAITGATKVEKDPVIFGAYAAGLVLAGHGLITLRSVDGFDAVMWLVLVVIATDMAGYFAGRTLGGPKFWPSVSPKKTWSGTAAGWVAAGFVGLAFGGPGLVMISVLMAFASQMGDAAESAIKRRNNVKDSSGLIPGHGGLLDRFDAMMAAALFVMIVSLVSPLPLGG